MVSAVRQNVSSALIDCGPGRYVNGRGYIMVLRPRFRRGGGKYVGEHILIAEKALGHPLPDAAEVHHFDNDHAHNENSNLIICEDHRYHELLHHRQRIADLGGDPNTEKQCTCCKRIVGLTECAPDKARIDGRNNKCKACELVRNRRRQASAFTERKCIACGCTDSQACQGGCSWLQVDYATGEGVCSSCADPELGEDET